MAGDTTLTIVGNLTGDPELRFVSSGAAVVNFTVASTPRKFNKDTNQWEDGEALFMRCSQWREPAENVAESLKKGMRVIVTGFLVSRSWEQNGEKRSAMEMQVEEVGPSLRYATATVARTARQGGAPAQAHQAPAAASPMGGAAGDPWATTPATGSEPPF